MSYKKCRCRIKVLRVNFFGRVSQHNSSARAIQKLFDSSLQAEVRHQIMLKSNIKIWCYKITNFVRNIDRLRIVHARWKNSSPRGYFKEKCSSLDTWHLRFILMLAYRPPSLSGTRLVCFQRKAQQAEGASYYCLISADDDQISHVTHAQRDTKF